MCVTSSTRAKERLDGEISIHIEEVERKKMYAALMMAFRYVGPQPRVRSHCVKAQAMRCSEDTRFVMNSVENEVAVVGVEREEEEAEEVGGQDLQIRLEECMGALEQKAHVHRPPGEEARNVVAILVACCPIHVVASQFLDSCLDGFV